MPGSGLAFGGGVGGNVIVEGKVGNSIPRVSWDPGINGRKRFLRRVSGFASGLLPLFYSERAMARTVRLGTPITDNITR